MIIYSLTHLTTYSLTLKVRQMAASLLILVLLLWLPQSRVDSLSVALRMVISRNSEHDNYVAKWQAKGVILPTHSLTNSLT